MAISEAQARAVAKYCKNNYDTVTIRFAKGEREKWKALATSQGLSINQFIVKSVEKEIRRLADGVDGVGDSGAASSN